MNTAKARMEYARIGFKTSGVRQAIRMATAPMWKTAPHNLFGPNVDRTLIQYEPGIRTRTGTLKTYDAEDHELISDATLIGEPNLYDENERALNIADGLRLDTGNREAFMVTILPLESIRSMHAIRDAETEWQQVMEHYRPKHHRKLGTV